MSRALNAVEIRWPFRLGLEGCIIDYSRDLGWRESSRRPRLRGLSQSGQGSTSSYQIRRLLHFRSPRKRPCSIPSWH